MLGTIFMIGILAILGIIALKLIFGIFGGIVGGLMAILFWALGKAIQIALIGLVVYFLLSIVSPDTARRLRERFSGPHT
jgi:membrane protein implicated in regulation of membrane protease activity